jgi:hypothetical protein
MLMKKFLLIITITLFSIHDLVAQAAIHWDSTIIVHDQPVSTAINKEGERAVNFRRTYGSEYGRMLKLSNGKWLAAYTVSRNDGYQKDPNGGFELEIAQSTTKGKTWKKISIITDNGRDLDNAQMIQLPNGAILLSCRSVRWQESYRLPVYRSDDYGNSWERISIIDTNEGRPGELGKPDKGVYEPHFYFLDDGRLAVMYANEKHVTDSISYSQIISQKISTDLGKSWGEEIWVAYESGHNESRPGMPVWTKMKNGDFIVVYEICGPERCGVYFKTSKDGYNWPVGLGNLIPEQTGGPYILSINDGTLVVTSNKGNISISQDYGRSWHLTERPWQHFDDFSKDWTQTVWFSLYQFNKKEVIAMTSVKRKHGGHNIQVRFGKIKRK